MSKFSAKHPEIQKHASLSVTTYTEGLLDVIKEEHAILGKGRSQLMKKWQEWGKLLDACVAAWEKCISAKDKLRQLEEQHAKWGPPAENRDILEQFRDLQVRVGEYPHILSFTCVHTNKCNCMPIIPACMYTDRAYTGIYTQLATTSSTMHCYVCIWLCWLTYRVYVHSIDHLISDILSHVPLRT